MHPNGAIFFLYSYQNKTLYTESSHEKGNIFVIQVIFFENEFEYASEQYTDGFLGKKINFIYANELNTRPD